MASIKTIKDGLSPDLNRLNELIRNSLVSDNQLMNRIVDSYLCTSGKQIRPIIVMLCAKMFGDVTERVLNAAAAIELLHNASLIHDDVVDETKMRRSTPTINAVWDNHIAVLVGDFFVSNAVHCAIATGSLEIIRVIGHLGKLLSLGEIDQIYNAREHSLTEESYFKVIRYKTASLFVACAEVGCAAANADAESTERLSKVAELLGLCFQIRDDIFDYFEEGKVGKPTGNDLREGKITLPLRHVLQNESTPNHAEMLTLVRSDVLSDEQIAMLTAYARDNGGIDYAYERMAELRQEAADILSGMKNADRAQSLMEIFDYIIARDF